MAEEQAIKQCPYCKEDVKAEAVKCKHCGSRIGSAMPEHGGICPYCKESINPEAILCKHCHSNLQASKDCGCSDKMGVSGSRTNSAGPLWSPFVMGGGGLGGGGRWPLNCYSYCDGPTLICVCRVPGTI